MRIDYLHDNFEIKETKLQMSAVARDVDISKYQINSYSKMAKFSTQLLKCASIININNNTTMA